MNDIKVNFGGEDCSVTFGQYSNGRTAIRLLCNDGEPMATATVNLPEVPIKDNEVIIKYHSENEGILSALFRAGIIDMPKQVLPNGAICKLSGTVAMLVKGLR